MHHRVSGNLNSQQRLRDDHSAPQPRTRSQCTRDYAVLDHALTMGDAASMWPAHASIPAGRPPSRRLQGLSQHCDLSHHCNRSQTAPTGQAHLPPACPGLLLWEGSHLYRLCWRGALPAASSCASFLASASSLSLGTTASTRPSLWAAPSLMGVLVSIISQACKTGQVGPGVASKLQLECSPLPASLAPDTRGHGPCSKVSLSTLTPSTAAASVLSDPGRADKLDLGTGLVQALPAVTSGGKLPHHGPFNQCCCVYQLMSQAPPGCCRIMDLSMSAAVVPLMSQPPPGIP